MASFLSQGRAGRVFRVSVNGSLDLWDEQVFPKLNMFPSEKDPAPCTSLEKHMFPCQTLNPQPSTLNPQRAGGGDVEEQQGQGRRERPHDAGASQSGTRNHPIIYIYIYIYICIYIYTHTHTGESRNPENPPVSRRIPKP